ncbi:15578_t:CDS:2, partial [Funneliformis geosporum]
KELGFYYQESKNKAKLIENQTINGEIIPNNIITVLIEKVCIENDVNLKYHMILEHIGNISIDDLDNIDFDVESISDSNKEKKVVY